MGFAATVIFLSAGFAGAMALGVAVFERRSISRWLLSGVMAVLAAEGVFSGLAAETAIPQEAAQWQTWSLVGLSFLPGLWLWFSLAYSRASGSGLPLEWRWVVAATFLAFLGLAAGFHRELIASAVQTETSFQWVFRLGTPGILLNALFLLIAIIGLMNLERTLRASVGTMRWRIKFMILGLGVLFAARAYTSSQVFLFHVLSLPLETLNACALILACLLILRSLLRAGQFTVDVYPSHSLVHSSLTLLLAGVYLFIVGVLARVVDALGGYAAFQIKTFLVLLSLVLLGLLLLSDRLRLRTRRFVSRHFQRPLYDYRVVWRTFTEGTARQIEETDLHATIVRLISDLFQALSVTLWLVDRGETRLSFASSTSLSRAQGGRLNVEAADAAQVINAFRATADPIDLDSSKAFWASAFRLSNPEAFPNGGHRHCIRLFAGGELLGLLVVGDRVGGLPFSIQDLDLLKSAADQAAASLLNIRLSHKLSQAKQLEAFQTMSAFFVHDLKSTAATLSLMLQNLPVHYQDPEFRKDALQGISKTVSHINDLIRRLGLLRQELAVQPVATDLNRLVSDSLKAYEESPGVEVVKHLEPIPNVVLDPAQIQKVITNLVLNARDAVGSKGEIRVETSRSNGWAILAVTDNGCGMTPEFVEGHLFRPFQTTKQNGIGIGMFHCKVIVESHRGKIEIESEPGKGTAVRVMLPLAAEASNS